MKKKDLFLGLGLLGALSVQAQSVYEGSTVPEEGSGTFYLYQVESGLWLQNNQRVPGQWTTHAQLDKNGFDVNVIKIDGGYQLDPKAGGNHSINSGDDRFYMDTNKPVSPWGFVPVTVSGVSNAYNIKALIGDGVDEEYLIGASGDQLSDKPEYTTWQLVSREERIKKMTAAVADGAVDATWLIPGQDLSRVDDRAALWTKKFSSDGSSVSLAGRDFNSVQEAWHRATNYMHYITLTDLPNGTYEFTLQGWYRDAEEVNEEYHQRVVDGTEVLRAVYFAGAASNYIKSITSEASDVEVADQYTYYIEEAGKWIPNSCDQASTVFSAGAYTNEWIKCVVTDGTLTIGVRKLDADHRDWLVYDNFQLRYVSTDTPAQDLTELNGFLADILAKAEALPVTPPAVAAAIEKAKAAQGSTSATELNEAALELLALVDGVSKAKDDISNFNATKTIAEAEGVDVTEAVEQFNAAVTRDEFADAIKTLRYARRRNAADKQEDVFKGQPVAAGDYYIYNVGQKQFLSPGSDWGAHAALNMPGCEITLEPEGDSGSDFHIDTHLYNGDSHYMNYRGYLDCPKAGAWRFVPVEGKENVYNIVQADYPDVHVAWNPYASVDAGNGDETTVGTECRGLQADDLNAQWKLVTKAERIALFDGASIDNPVDATVLIKSPGFNQREKADVEWVFSHASIWEYGANHNDFAAESYNTESCDINQMVTGMPQGVYVLSAQGFYRNGAHDKQPNLEPLQNAILYAGMDYDVYLPNIMECNFMAPGEGNNAVSEEGETYQYPDGIVQATNFFRSGLYRTHITLLKDDDLDFPIGMAKDEQGEEGDWAVIDNFRLTYYGNNTTIDEVEEKVTTGVNAVRELPAVRVADNTIYNMQGIRVTNVSKPGLYIINGKKVVVK